MQTTQTRSIPVAGVLVAVLLGAALIAAIGLLALGDTIDLPMTGSSEAPGLIAGNDVDAPSVAAGESSTRAGHRYQLYLADGVTMSDALARYQGANSSPADHANHRYFSGETVLAGDADFPDGHRVELNTD